MHSSLPLNSPLSLDKQKVHKGFKRSKNILFITGVIGQFLFVLYILLFYGGVALRGSYDKLNGHGVIEGDTMGNAMLALHVALAAVVIFGGPLQFSSRIRKRYPSFHRWNGRVYFLTAFVVVFAGLFMNATRGAHGGIVLALGNGLNALLIGGFSIMAWRSAVKKDFAAHKKWAIRAFLMVSGVWFFRIGYGLWILLTGFTAIGANADLTGPFDRFLGFGHSLVPLALIELYFWAKASEKLNIKRYATLSMWVLSLLLAAGIVMVSLIFWLPAFT